LDLAFKNGYKNVRRLQTVTDLNALHDSPQWEKLVSAMQQELDRMEANLDKPLQVGLLQILEDDQKFRKQIGEIEKKYGFQSVEMQELWRKMAEMDSINLIKVTAILAQHGWVGADKVGAQANQALFLVIQHAGLYTQQKYLPLMREAVKHKLAHQYHIPIDFIRDGVFLSSPPLPSLLLWPPPPTLHPVSAPPAAPVFSRSDNCT
ncbi:MAG: hypothetical protein L6Q97_07965, partial [Thermoanaerobaculia bacterium]|nr:hypothetical protein [Thermoanaerobaculia bacterium]